MQTMAFGRPARAQWVVGTDGQRLSLNADVPAVDEALGLEIEGQDAVEAGGGEKDAILGHADFVAVTQVRIGEGVEQAKVSIEHQQMGIRGDQNMVAVKGDAPQAAIAAASAEVDVGVIPIQFQGHAASLQIDQVKAAVAFAEMGASNHRGDEEGWQRTLDDHA
jgi:hypothetical protein